jgi:co-chaperonin GroES (HSP10)
MSAIPRPFGPRVVVELIKTSLSIVERGKQSGLTVITSEVNDPKPTLGRILALGTDPMIQEMGFRIGMVVTFAGHAGTRVFVQDSEYRSLELQEIIAEIPEEDNGTGTIGVDGVSGIGNEPGTGQVADGELPTPSETDEAGVGE